MGRLFTLIVLCIFSLAVSAQDRMPSTNMWLKAFHVSGAQVPYAYDGKGKKYEVEWGMDVAWNSSGNVTRGTNYIGQENLKSGRISFQPSDSVGENLQLSNSQSRSLRSRINNIKISGVTNVILNCDHEALNSDNYYGKPREWYKVIKASVLYAKSQGLNVTSVLPFNEPDYTAWGEGTQAHFKEIARLIKEDPEMEGIRVCGGNTLNCDQALSWYNYMKPYIDEGNTHQLAGGFRTYAQFFETVRSEGKHATADELHNSMEAFVAVHYGLQTGIWWGYDGLARGDICKATCGGEELGYGENRSAWAAGAVYRLPNGSVEGFVGVSERQANKNWIDLVATDRDVFYEGYGPVRLYQQFLPGDGVYGSTNQKNADKVIHIICGDDVPLDTIGGEYVIMNKATEKLMAPIGSAERDAVQLRDKQNNGLERWRISPTSHLKGGDFSYHYITNVGSGMYLNLLNNSLNTRGTFIIFNAGGSDNEQYCFEYAGNGFFYIRNHLSGLYLEANGEQNIRQNVFRGTDVQKWRFMPVEAKCEMTPPAAPTGLKTTPQPASVILTWDENTDEDLNGYLILRGCDRDGETVWETIGRNIKTTSFLDNGCLQGVNYVYKIKAVDLSGNRSEDSEVVAGAATAEDALIAEYEFDGDLYDSSVNNFDAVLADEMTFVSLASQVKSGTNCLAFDGKLDYLLIPNQVANLRQLTISTWIYNGAISTKGMKIFDFGNGSNDRYMYFTPNNGSKAELVIKNGDEEQTLAMPSKIGTGWKYLSITMSESEVKIYLDGEEVASSTEFTLRPADVKPSICFIGRSQSVSDPLFKGRLDALRIYNYALSPEQIKDDMGVLADAINELQDDASLSPVVSTEYYNLSGARTNGKNEGIVIVKERHQNGAVTTRKIVR